MHTDDPGETARASAQASPRGLSPLSSRQQSDRSAGLAQFQSSIQEHMADLSPKQRALARYIVENQSAVMFATANEVGSAVGASGATTVRFAQLLGYDGFTELRDSLRDRRPGLSGFP